MSGATNGSGDGQRHEQGSGQNPGGFRPAEPAARQEGGLTVEAGLQEIKRIRARAAKPGANTGAAAPAGPAGRQAADTPAAAEAGEQTEQHEEQQQQQQQETEGQRGAEGAEGGGGEPRFRVEGVGEVGVGELVQGYLRQADYTAKTQASASAQQQMQEAHQAFTTMRAQLEARLAQVTKDMAPEFEISATDWVKLAKEDPLGYQEKHARYTAFQELKREQETLATQAAREQYAQKTRVLQAANEYLGRALPTWKEPAKRSELLVEIREYAKSRGYSDQELDGQEVLDPRQILVLHDAMQYRKIAGRKYTPQPNGGAGPGPRGTPPTPAPARRESDLRQSFDRDRNIKSATALVSALRHRPPGRR